MRITIGIPVRNGEPHLWQAIDSAIRQTRPADEILVIDDASIDQSAAIATSAEWAGRVRYVFNGEPSGFADAFNRLANLATGDFLSVLCADDLLDADCLAVLEEGLSRFPQAKLCHAGFRYVNERGEPTSTSAPPHSREGELLPGRMYTARLLDGVKSGTDIHRCVGFLVDLDLMRSSCAFRREAGLIADTDFLVRVASRTDVVRITQPLASVRVHPDSLSNRLDSLALRLAEDYLFQIQSAQKGKSDFDILATFEGLATRFIDELFAQSIRSGRTDLFDRAVFLQKWFASLASSERPLAIRPKKTVLWRYAGRSAAVASLLRILTIVIARMRRMRENSHE